MKFTIWPVLTQIEYWLYFGCLNIFKEMFWWNLFWIFQWEELYRTKPDETYEDPEDVASIEHAQKTIGDFKLKTAADFVVPEEERVNAEKKRAELFDLKVNVRLLVVFLASWQNQISILARTYFGLSPISSILA